MKLLVVALLDLDPFLAMVLYFSSRRRQARRALAKEESMQLTREQNQLADRNLKQLQQALNRRRERKPR